MSPAGDSPSVTVSIVNWNSAEDVLACLHHVAALEYPNRDVVVVDNASRDGSAACIAGAYPHVRVVAAGGNVGYGGGHNLVIRDALTRERDFVWVLNPDVTFESGTLGALVTEMEGDARLGLVSPRVYHPQTGRLEQLNTFAPFASRPPAALALAGRRTGSMQMVDCVPGCSVLVRLDTVREVGAFDERYFHFWEDVDLCRRVWRGGWKVAVTDRAQVAHRGGSSTHDQDALSMYYSLRNLVLFASASAESSPPRALLTSSVMRQVLACLLGARTALNPPVKIAILRALHDTLGGHFGRCPHYSPP